MHVFAIRHQMQIQVQIDPESRPSEPLGGPYLSGQRCKPVYCRGEKEDESQGRGLKDGRGRYPDRSDENVILANWSLSGFCCRDKLCSRLVKITLSKSDPVIF